MACLLASMIFSAKSRCFWSLIRVEALECTFCLKMKQNSYTKDLNCESRQFFFLYNWSRLKVASQSIHSFQSCRFSPYLALIQVDALKPNNLSQFEALSGLWRGPLLCNQWKYLLRKKRTRKGESNSAGKYQIRGKLRSLKEMLQGKPPVNGSNNIWKNKHDNNDNISKRWEHKLYHWNSQSISYI